MEIREELRINCPAPLAFDTMADVRLITKWNDSVSRAEMTSDEPIGVGSQFITVNRGQQLQSTITTYERPELLKFNVTGKLMDVAGTFSFVGTDAGTTLAITFNANPKGFMSLLFPLLGPMIRRDLRNQHVKFKKFCEAQNQSSDA
jgi:hypothetical protein